MSVTAPPSPLSHHLAHISNLPVLLQKGVSSILGAVTADAAARPLHWVYDMEDMAHLLEQNRNPEFWPESKSPFYTLPTGARSCYSHVMMAGLQAFIEAKGEPNLTVYRTVLRTTFGVGTEWQEALSRRKEVYSPDRRREKREPVTGPWLHGAVIRLLETGEAQADNTEMDALLLCLPHLVFRVERENVLEECLTIASLLSGVQIWVRTQVEVLRTVMVESSLSREDVEELEVEEEAWEALEQVWDNLETGHTEAVEHWGNNCHLPGSLQGALHSFLQCQEQNTDYIQAVRNTIVAGGCNCSRGNYLGSLLGARGGMAALPQSWMERVTDLNTILSQTVQAAQIVYQTA